MKTTKRFTNIHTTKSELDIDGLMGSHYIQAIMSTQVAKDNRSKQVAVLVSQILAGTVLASRKGK